MIYESATVCVPLLFTAGDGISNLLSGATFTIRNNVVVVCTTSNYSSGCGASGSTNNTSSDATTPLSDSSNLVSQTLTFSSSSGRDFRLVSGDTSCINNALRMSSDSNTPFDGDSVGFARPSGNWDRGALERI